jgi:hypothetical protein
MGEVKFIAFYSLTIACSGEAYVPRIVPVYLLL